jgi:hypothetical protein
VPLAAPLDARRGLLAGLIDHAPTFPPEELPLDEALRAHEAALHSEPGWICNRFVVRASHLARLPELRPPRLSVVVDAPPAPDERIEAFETTDAAWMPPAEAEVFVEHPVGPEFDAWVAGLGGRRAKLRCGPTAPTAEDLAAAIRSCRERGVAFKATAGLHHAVRTNGHHGFLNLLAAAAFGDEEAALAETDAAAFAVDADAFHWRNRTASPEEIAAMRRDLFLSFGSCSFTEPVDELRALGLL